MSIWTKLRQAGTWSRSGRRENGTGGARTSGEMRGAPARKASSPAPWWNGGWSWLDAPGPRWGARSYMALAEEGYRRNVIVHRSVRLVAECAASVPLLLERDGARIDDHPVFRRLAHRPSPAMGADALFDTLHAHLMLAGEAWLLRIDGRDGVPLEFHPLRPDRVRGEGRGRGPWPARYVVEEGDGRRRVFPLDPLTGRSALLHLKTFHPLDGGRGIAPAEAAAMALEIHNATGHWNKALLDNAARPSGALVFEPKDGAPAMLTESQLARLRSDIEAQFQGARNAGRPLLLEGGLKWQPMAFSPAEMDFINLRHAAARDIALAFGVPPMLLGIPGDNTYSNYQEANRAFWRLTVLPLVARVARELTVWLEDVLPTGAEILPDRDEVARRTGERESFWREIDALSFLTPAEKRALAGIEEALAGNGSAPTPASFGLPAGVEPKHRHWRTEPRIPKGRPGGGRWTTEGGAGGDTGGGRNGSASDAAGRSRKRRGPGSNDDARSTAPRADRPTRALFKEDRSFIEGNEGGLQTSAKIPEDKDGKVIGKSGATIGAGVDLGQHSEADLRAAGVPEPVIEKVRPYLGLKGEEAQRFLDRHPLTLTESEARILTDRVHDGIIRQVAARYDAASDGVRFADLPAEAQTVIADVAIQFGPNLDRATPRFWRFVTTGDWEKALAELRDFHDQPPDDTGNTSTPRRRREANKWEKALGRFPKKKK